MTALLSLVKDARDYITSLISQVQVRRRAGAPYPDAERHTLGNR